MKKKKLVIISGPTAVGKSVLSVALAKKINGEIISADSMQVYKHMNIGTAKITQEEMDGVPHYLLDVLEPSEAFHVVRFKEMALDAIEKIYKKGKTPIIVGGTGFYIQALLYDVDFKTNINQEVYEKKYNRILDEEGVHALHEELQKVDPKSAEIIHENNVKRMIKALVFYDMNGECISAHNEAEMKKESAYDSSFFVITDNRDVLYERINRRVDQMMEDGLLNEVRELLKMGCKEEWVSMQGIGYKEIIDSENGMYSLDRAIELIKQGSRHYAKRQLTWFRREKNVIWVDREKFSDDNNKMLEFMIDNITSNNKKLRKNE